MGCAAGIPQIHRQDANVQAQQRPLQLGHKLSTTKQLCPASTQQKPHLWVESSWDSVTWRDLPKGMPVPPNRITHQNHLRIMNKFRKEVEVHPEAFSDIVTARRQTSTD
ncbi:unnamed protein product [Symbiodinium sp. CCMP2592]|nr:unnamed protein product [Symbiodinium sp. CCMP2592]